jgi:hypothetical protein
MPPKPSWILQLPRIKKILESADTPVVDRASFEKLFGVRRRRAIQLMHHFDGYLAGRTFVVERTKLLESLRRLGRNDYDWELTRRTKLASEIETARRLLPARKVRLMVSPDATDRRMADLPPGVHLRAGELRIEFHGTEDLLRHLFELSQAMVNDYKKFEEVCESGMLEV